MKRYIAFFSSLTEFSMESCRLLNSYDDIESAMSDMEKTHSLNYTRDFKWEKESGFIFDLKENKYCKREDFSWRDFPEIPLEYHKIIEIT